MRRNGLFHCNIHQFRLFETATTTTNQELTSNNLASWWKLCRLVATCQTLTTVSCVKILQLRFSANNVRCTCAEIVIRSCTTILQLANIPDCRLETKQARLSSISALIRRKRATNASTAVLHQQLCSVSNVNSHFVDSCKTRGQALTLSRR